MGKTTSNRHYGVDDNTGKGRGFLFRLLFLALFVFIIFALFSSFITQALAKNYGYPEQFGSPVVGSFYMPFDWINWYRLFGGQDAYFNRIIRIRLLGGGLVLVFSLFVFFYYAKQKRDEHPDLHGSARFATYDDIKKMGVLSGSGNEGPYIGAFGKDTAYLRHNGPEHIFCFAPTRSGKGVSVVIPTLLSWPHSCVVYDLKSECWSLTASWRKKHNNNVVLRFEPTCNDGTGARYNPLSEIRLNTDFDVADAQNVALMIIDDTGKGLYDYWHNAAYDFVTGLILYSLYKSEEGTSSITDVARLVSDPERPIAETLIKMQEHEHPVIAQCAATMLNKADEERSGVLGTATSKLSLFRDPVVSKNISCSDFRLSDLMNNDKPVSLYICVGATDKDRLRPLTRILITQMLRSLTTKVEYSGGVPKTSYTHRLLLLIDEFPSLGKMESFHESLGFLAGYGIKCLLIAQDLTQLRGAYGRDESITANCHVRVAFAPNTVDTAELLSKMTGITTVSKKEVSHTIRGKGAFSKSTQNVSRTEVRRNLLTADEIMRLSFIDTSDPKNIKPGACLIFVGGNPVILGVQIVYFADPVFSARAKLGCPPQSDKITSDDSNENIFSKRIEDEL